MPTFRPVATQTPHPPVGQSARRCGAVITEQHATPDHPRPSVGAEEGGSDMMAPYGTPVSFEMQRLLDSLTGLDGLPAETGHPPAAAAGDYPQFTWFNGCYYGKYGESGRWYLQYCNRYRPSERAAVTPLSRISPQCRPDSSPAHRSP